MRTLLTIVTISVLSCACYVGGGGGPISDAASAVDAAPDADAGASPVDATTYK